ncbi:MULTISPECIES: flagellar protein FlaG [unclassified Pseudoalteromonas]|uniref:flagellar protein FlaG n=1 Tax=unclassified Pseudoalteromonas TaxID=194690 RepID=UPI0006CA1CB7|nr:MULTISPECIES: flagellar protein FlaG [unclassified Pseudoalteromonas]KPM78018.1 flagellar biosynthesis protein FlaG [Pseudoalteromonas sp. UCD-33C]KPW02910.1 flagellar protein FlaG [Pseudoalteromonas sp. P1-8]KPZ74711.1 flagellar protein FlaG [Pseudoalteromonas sp. P1-26]
MIDINSAARASDNVNTSNSVSVKSVLDEEKLNKGTEIASREPVNIDEVSSKKRQEKQDMIAEVKENLEKLNKYIPVTSTNLIFEFDELGEPPIIKVLDKESEEVIREIPTEEFREVAKALDEFADKLTSKGMLFNHSA